ncbi:hypothetical protein OPIT5_05910 [Opitutaceae bacterium TAV5]|nr:hypothetical protein OPIT5_05910 [Opitutaceae bacterium TAV5]
MSCICARTAVGAEDYDLIIYGGSSAGVVAAMQVRRMGGSAIIIEPSSRIEGMTTGGLGQTDIGNKHVIGGIAREFYQEVKKHYQDDAAWKWQTKPSGEIGTGHRRTSASEDTQWTFEPGVALSIYERWIKENPRSPSFTANGSIVKARARRRIAETGFSSPCPDRQARALSGKANASRPSSWNRAKNFADACSWMPLTKET